MNRIAIAIGLLLIWTGLSFAAGWAWRGDRAEAATAKRDTADVTAVVEAVQDARTTEHTQAEKLADIGDEHEVKRGDAAGVPASVVADLQSGALQLRDELAGCATDRLSGATAAAIERDAANQLRGQIAGAVVQVGRDADDLASACRAVIWADREGSK